MVRPYEIADRADCLQAFDSNAPRYFLPEERIQFERFLDQLLTAIVGEILGLENVHAVRLETSQHTRAFFERSGLRAVDVVRNGFGPGLDRVAMRAAVADLRRTDNR